METTSCENTKRSKQKIIGKRKEHYQNLDKIGIKTKTADSKDRT